MSEHTEEGPEEKTLVTNRPMDILVALLLLAISAIVIWDSWRVGSGWIEGQGPAPGYFPFYVALILGISSLINLVRALLNRDPGGSEVFVTQPALPRVLAVLLPAIAYVTLIEYIGIYVASAIFLMGFMLVFGRENLGRTLAVGVLVPIALFFLFEKWFLVPLPKGPLEAMLGL